MASPEFESLTRSASPNKHVLPSISSPGETTELPSGISSTNTSADVTGTHRRSKLVNLPTLHPELEGYTPGEFMIRISNNICRGLSSQQSKIASAKTESNDIAEENSVKRSIQQFEEILKKREEMSPPSRGISSKSRVVGDSMNLELTLNDENKRQIQTRIVKRSNTMRNLVSSNLSLNRTPPTTTRKNKDRILPMEQGNLNQPVALCKSKSVNPGVPKKQPSYVSPTSAERDRCGTAHRKHSIRQNSDIAYRLRLNNHRNHVRRQSMIPLAELRRAKNSTCRFNEYGEAKFFFAKTVRMVTILRKWWTEFSSKYQSVEYQMKTYLDIANDIEEVSSSRGQGQNNSGMKFDPKYFKASREIGISKDVMLILCMRPHQRTNKHIQKVVNGLQSLQAYAEYPLYMQEQLARVAYYQEITPKRVIVRQGHTPENFYFILSGTASVKVIVRNEHNVSVNVVATLTKGQSFGEIALLHNSCRTATVESVSPMKLLSIWKDDFLEIFFNLKSDIEPKHISFCRDIPFLKHWPIKEIMKDPSNCFTHFFRRGTVVVPDSQKNDWIYIVKTGSCRILKRLKAVEPYKTWDGKRPTHGVLQDFGSVQKESKTNSGISKTRALAVTSPLERAMTEFFLTKDPQINVSEDQETKPVDIPEQPAEVQEAGRQVKDKYAVPACMTSHSKSAIKSFLSQCKVNRSVLPVITKSNEKKGQTFVKPARPAQPCYITLKKLLPKDAFGLESVEFEDEQYDRPSVSVILVSDGSELVIVSKAVFVKFSNEFVRQYVREHVQYYPSEDILQENLQTEMNWELFKDEVLQDTVDKLGVAVS